MFKVKRFRVLGSGFKGSGFRGSGFRVQRLKSNLNRCFEDSEGKSLKIERFEDIEAWQLARELTHKVYELTKKPRFARDFGLKGQIQDAAGSSMHNIAEGFDKKKLTLNL